MPLWLWFAPLGAIIAALGVWAFRLGWIAATITETDVITLYAEQYLETAGSGARQTDCVARPASDRGIWLVVSCDGVEGRFDYAVDRFGRLLDVQALSAPSQAPET